MLSSSVRALVTRHDSKMGARGSRAHQKGFVCISTVRAFVMCALSSGHHRGSPSNRPVSDPSMAHLP